MLDHISQVRTDHLSRTADLFAKNPEEHLSRGCKYIPNGDMVNPIKKRVAASVYGVVGYNWGREYHDLAIRWLVSNTYHAVDTYRPQLKRPQWENIIRHYFAKSNGLFAEVSITERLLLAHLLRESDAEYITDPFLADSIADYYMMSDMIWHVKLPRGTLKLGVQLSTRLALGSKIDDLHGHTLHDRDIQPEGTALDHFLRDGTIILGTTFNSGARIRAEAMRHVLYGSLHESGYSLMRQDLEKTKQYSRQIGAMMSFFIRGVIDEIIKQDSIGIDHHNYFHDVGDERVSGQIITKRGLPLVRIKYVGAPQRTSGKSLIKPKRPLLATMCAPIEDEFLDRVKRYATPVNLRNKRH